MLKTILFFCSFILLQLTTSQAQVFDFFDAANITISGDDYKVSRINVSSQGDRSINGEKVGVDKLDVTFHNGLYIQALSIPADTKKEIAQMHIKKTFNMFGTGNKEVQEGITKNMKQSKITLKNQFMSGESLETIVGESKFSFTKYGKAKEAWYKIYTLPDEKNKRIVFIIAGEEAEAGKSQADKFEKLMDGLKHDVK